jgi:hypothetical protein
MLKKKLLLSRSREMTLPDERYRAVQYAQQFLQRLAGGEYPRVPKAVRQEARSILRHYPNAWDMTRATETSPEVFQEHMEPLYRMIKQRELEQQIKVKLEFVKSIERK